MGILNKNPTICIPCVSNSITQKYIYELFNTLKLGTIQKIEYFPTSKGFKKVFIVFNKWFETEKSQKFKKKILNNEIVYVEYISGVWKCKMLNNHR